MLPALGQRHMHIKIGYVIAAHPKTARAKAVARKGSSGAAVMKAQAIAVTEHPVAVIFVIIASPLETFSTVWPSVICIPAHCTNCGNFAEQQCHASSVLPKPDPH